MKISVMLILFSIIALSGLISCTEESKDLKTFVDFENNIHLSNEKEVTTFEQFCPGNIYIVDTLILINESNCSEYLFHVYSADDFVFIGSFGKKGKGPGEFMNLRYNSQYEKEHDGSYKLWVYSSNRLKMYKINLIEAIGASDESFIEKTIDLPAECYPPNHVIIIEKHHVIIGDNDMNEFGRFFRYNYDSDTFDWLSIGQQLPDETAKENTGAGYFGLINYNTDRDIFVSCMGFFERIDLITPNGRITSSILRKNNNPPPQFRDPDFPHPRENYFYYDGLQITDKYIIVSNWDVTDKIRLSGAAQNKKIQFFSWDGKPLYNFIMPKSYINFAFDQNNRKLYIIDFDDEEYPIKYYELDNYM